ncbi:MAG: hypothetical protein MJZ30_06830 [Paludibacteraceae bacterium]|nr:hypothetical protein [Paludibacteraceae bacterium]
MKTRFFFPVVAMIAFATVTNAAAFKLGVNESGVEVASVEKVDARAGVETSVLGARLSGLASVFTSGAEMDIKVDKRVDFRMDVDAKAGAELARRMDVDAKAGTKASVCGAGQKGLTSGFECGAETSIQVTAGMDGRIEI